MNIVPVAQVTTVPDAHVYVLLYAGMPCVQTAHVCRCGACVDMAAYVASTEKKKPQ